MLDFESRLAKYQVVYYLATREADGDNAQIRAILEELGLNSRGVHLA